MTDEEFREWYKKVNGTCTHEDYGGGLRKLPVCAEMITKIITGEIDKKQIIIDEQLKTINLLRNEIEGLKKNVKDLQETVDLELGDGI